MDTGVDLWKTDAFKNWWKRDYSWSGLKEANGDVALGQSIQNRRAGLFDYWQSVDAGEFSFGSSGRTWSRFHLPRVDINGVVCPDDLWLEAKGEKFSAAIQSLLSASKGLSEADFQQRRNTADSWQYGARFNGVVFSGADPDGRIAFLPDDERLVAADFSDAIFLQIVHFNGQGIASRFTGSLFAQPAYFYDAKFPGGANFARSTFLDFASFPRTNFGRPAIFRSVSFEDGVAFAEAHFADYADFSNSRLTNQCSFDQADFNDFTSFQGAVFDSTHKEAFGAFRRADFSGAKFRSHVIFRRAAFNVEAVFRGNTHSAFEGVANFSGAEFSELADFCGRQFLDQTDFTACRFGDIALFHGARLHPETYFEQRAFTPFPNREKFLRSTADVIESTVQRALLAAYQDVDEPELRKPLLERFRIGIAKWYRESLVKMFPSGRWGATSKKFRVEWDREIARYEFGFRSLRLRAQENSNIEDEGMFYRLELDARRRRPNVRLSERLVATLYKHSSDYGQSLTRPIGWLFLLLFASVWAHLLALDFSNADVAPTTFLDVVYWSLRQFIPPPLVWSEQEMSNASAWVKELWRTSSYLVFGLGTFQAVAFVALVTTFLVALRRRFQMR